MSLGGYGGVGQGQNKPNKKNPIEESLMKKFNPHFEGSKYQPKPNEPESVDLREKILDKQLGNARKGTCCICGTNYTNYGHNANPVMDGRCCDNCQETKVLPARQAKGTYDTVDLLGKAKAFYEAGNDMGKTPDKLMEELGMPNQKLSKEYIKISNESYKKMQKKIPNLWRAMMIKRYVLPQWRQADYFNQEACDYLMLDFLLEFSNGARGVDEVLNTQYVSLLRAMEYGRPTLFLEKEFALPLMKTPLHDDYEIGDIKWRWPSFRVYLPKGFLTIKRDGQDCSLMFMDIVRIEKDADYVLPPKLIEEIKHLTGEFHLPSFSNKYGGMGVSGNLDFDCPQSAIAYAGTTPIDATNVRKVMSIVGSKPLISTLKSDELDNEFTTKMLAIALKILLILSAYEIIPDPDQSEIIRKPKLDGQHHIVGLYHAKFVGKSIMKLTESGAKAKGIVGTGRTIAAHWVSGHFQRIAYGPKHSLRKLMWIGIYHTGEIK